MSSILIIGADGHIGRALSLRCQERGLRFIPTTRRPSSSTGNAIHLDLSSVSWRDLESVIGVIDVAVVCAGVTKVAYCEDFPVESRLTNVQGTLKVIEYLRSKGVFLVFLSSSLVFDGNSQSRSTSDPVSPSTEYGRQKVTVEQELLNGGGDFSILRMSKIISPKFPLFLNWARQLSENKEIFPFKDKMIAPVTEEFAVNTILRIIEQRAIGLFHLSSSYEISYHQAAEKIANLVNAPLELISPVAALELGFTAERYAALNTESVESLGLIAPDPFDVFETIDFDH